MHKDAGFKQAKNILYAPYFGMISKINPSVNFKGYDARPLYAVAMRNTDGFALNEAASQMRQIGAKHGFKVIFEDGFVSKQEERKREIRKEIGGEISEDSAKKPRFPVLASLEDKFLNYFSKREKSDVTSWMQDCIYFTKDGILTAENNAEDFLPLSNTFGVKINTVPSSSFIAGGNLYILKDDKKEKILVGASENREKALEMFPGREVISIPQADFHIDLVIRPLRDNTVLVADDDMSLDILKNAADVLKKFSLESGDDKSLKEAESKLCKLIKKMESGRKTSVYKDTNSVIQTLEENGFRVIRTPGRVYRTKFVLSNIESSIENELNFMNAIVHEDKDGELCYISNKSNLLEELGISKELAGKIGLDFEEEFKKAISEFVKPENIYFIDGAAHKPFLAHRNIPNILKYLGGGVHCLCAEIPKEVLNK